MNTVFKTHVIALSLAALSFTLMAIILVGLLVYIKFAGSEALMGDEEEAA